MTVEGIPRRLSGWGNLPRADCTVYVPDSVREVRQIVRAAAEPSLIARGLGRAYGDAALNEGAGVVMTDGLGAFVSFERGSGVIECEAGASLSALIDVCLPHRWFPKVLPGTRNVTVGGAIASDIHGKNHHTSGSFGRHVLEFSLLTADGAIVRCSRDENRDLFDATVGGMGLTGTIVSARLQLGRVETALMDVETRRTQSLEETLAVIDGRRDATYAVAWVDCSASGAHLGRGAVFLGEHAAFESLPSERRAGALNRRLGLNKPVPAMLPDFIINRASIGGFNRAYYAAHNSGRHVEPIDPYFFPLDGVENWNRVYGPRGFAQYQSIVPPESGHEGLRAQLEAIIDSRIPSFLAVVKWMGEQGDGLLSFPMPGYTLSVDVPNTGTSLVALMHRLEEVCLAYRGRVYLAKDAFLRPESLPEMYPRLQAFREIKARVDPRGRFSSSLSRRLGLTP